MIAGPLDVASGRAVEGASPDLPCGHVTVSPRQYVRALVIPLLLVLVTCAVFLPSCAHPFVGWDDDQNIYQNPDLLPPTWAGVVRAWKQPYFCAYIPITRTVWAAIAGIAARPDGHGGTVLTAAPFHVANLLVHLLNVLLVLAILRRLVKRPWAAAAGALLFAVHPVQVEPVAWATGMKDLAGALFSLLCLWQYVCFAQRVESGESRVEPDSRLTTHDSRLTTPESPARPLARSRIHYVLALLCFGLALLSKPSAASLPLALIALDVWAMRRSMLRSVKAVGWWMLLAIPIAVITRAAERTAEGPGPVSLGGRFLVTGDTLTFYVTKLFWPVRLCVDYGRSPERVLAHGWVWMGWLLPIAVGIVAWRLRRSQPWLLASCTILVAAVLPVSGLTPFAHQLYSTVADRYLYLALLGPALAVASLLAAGTRQSMGVWEYGGMGVAESGIRYTPTPPHAHNPTRFVPVAYALILSLLAGQSVAQSGSWDGSVALFRHVLAVNPGSWMARNNLGFTYKTGGEVKRAEAWYRSALELRPGYADALNNLGAALMDEGRAAGAIPHLECAVRLRPDWATPRYNLGCAYLSQKRVRDAFASLVAAARIDPGLAAAHFQLGRILAANGRPQEAVDQLRLTLRLQPRFAPAAEELKKLTG